MAEDGNIAVEISSAITNNEISSHDQDVFDMKKKSDLIDQKDSRTTDPDGAQSPASSTYADCDEQDFPDSSNADETITDNQENLTNNSPEIIIDNKNDISPSSVTSDKEEFKDADPIHIENSEVLHNGDVNERRIEEKSIISEDQNHFENNDDYEDIDSEEYEIENGSGDEYKSHDSQDETNKENGEGEEDNEQEVIQKKLDDDEDRRNPQYIPKRGFFYEHDDRTAGTGSENEAEGTTTVTTTTKEAPASELESKRKNRRSVPDGQWQHDLYKEDEQKSKSAQELIDIYGYDIRNEESAPKARRRRRYGRGPNRYTRKWDDEKAYGKQTSKSFRTTRRQKPLPVKREEYDAEFPELDRKPHKGGVSRERQKSPTPFSKPSRNYDLPKSDNEIKYKEERHRTPTRKLNIEHTERPSRSFTKRIPISTSIPPKEYNAEISDVNDSNLNMKPLRTKFVVNNNVTIGSRGRGIPVNKTTRYVNNTNDYESRVAKELRMQTILAGRGRARRLDRPNINQNSFSNKTNDDEIRELTEQMAMADLRSRRNAPIKDDASRRLINEQLQEQSAPAGTTIRSKRYSYQRQRLLPDSNNEKNIVDANLQNVPNVQSLEGHSIANMVQSADNNGLHQVATAAASHKSVPLIPQNQLTSTTPSDTPSLSVNAASIPSNSLAVSASLIPLSAPPMTASGAALQAGGPPLPIMGFFQHPQGFTNQGTPAQIYTREQNIIGAPSNQPVQLVAFLPATPMLSNTNHTQSAPAAPSAPPPPPTYPAPVMSYPQPSSTQQTQPSFNSETYSMPPVTLAPIHQAEMYQSRGGVTYYNTRSQVKPRSPPPPRVKTAIPIVPPPNEK